MHFLHRRVKYRGRGRNETKIKIKRPNNGKK
jgi:hypothetical protein